MVTKLEQLKEWAKQNVTLIDLLPNNNGLQVTIRLIDVLEDKVDEKYYLSDEKVEKLTLDFSLTSQDKHGVAIREATKQGYALAEQGDSVNVSYPTSKTRRGRVGKQVAQTLQAGEVNQGVVMN
ncbi:DNA (cytosine-5-)-methyltransferase, partial [Staphylococcus saprophyticus]|nr:DNA (cytosine-5-)-methyltransferase [Staphylococcus saprophyticus]